MFCDDVPAINRKENAEMESGRCSCIEVMQHLMHVCYRAIGNDSAEERAQGTIRFPLNFPPSYGTPCTYFILAALKRLIFLTLPEASSTTGSGTTASP